MFTTWITAHARPFRFSQKLKAGEAGNKAMCKHCLCLDPDTVYLELCSLSIEEHYLAVKFINSLILLEIPTVHVGSPSHSLLFKISWRLLIYIPNFPTKPVHDICIWLCSQAKKAGVSWSVVKDHYLLYGSLGQWKTITRLRRTFHPSKACATMNVQKILNFELLLLRTLKKCQSRNINENERA